MNDDIKNLLKDLKDVIEVISHKVSDFETSKGLASHQVTFMRDQQSVMNEKLDHQSKVLDEHTEKLKTLDELTDKVDAFMGTWKRSNKKLDPPTTWLKQPMNMTNGKLLKSKKTSIYPSTPTHLNKFMVKMILSNQRLFE